MVGEEIRTKEGAGFGSFVVWVCAVLVFYVLSIGPAVRLHEKAASQSLKTTIEIVYAPVVVLIENTPLRTAGEWWVSQWRGPPPKMGK